MSTAQLALERGKVTRPVADLCQGGRVRVAYDNDNWSVNNGTNRMVEQPLSICIENSAAMDSEILATFFHEHKITPTFIYNEHTYSEYDEEGVEWTGAAGLVSFWDTV